VSRAEPRQLSVLLVDDVPDLRTLIRTVLEGSGVFKVVAEAGDGLEAVEQARLHQPDLTLLDLSMPRGDGLQALPLVREAAPETLVVILSGFERERMWKITSQLGAVGYLEKGTPPDELVETLIELTGVLDLAAGVLEEATTLLEPHAASSAEARRFVEAALEQWDCRDQLEVVRLLVSEIVTNAVVHAGTESELVVRLTEGGLRVEVRDQSTAAPVVQDVAAEETSGRGLALVEALATDWGVDASAGGKSVWFEVPRLGA
jgi:DNA-binding NarL/FixJ family response regulator